ncbi:hypothetical protein [Deinococcus altitudinis]|uniref:hypothetical protein n=1 Tax=Deinococcus altitudinis TaxID=468914 RepID=UPI00389220E2
MQAYDLATGKTLWDKPADLLKACPGVARSMPDCPAATACPRTTSPTGHWPDRSLPCSGRPA